MATVRLEGQAITDWPSFHRESRVKFGFPEFYGNNMDAWIDCLSSLREPGGGGMVAFALTADDILQIEMAHSAQLRRRAPQILAALAECVEAVNERYTDHGEKPALSLKLL